MRPVSDDKETPSKIHLEVENRPPIKHRRSWLHCENIILLIKASLEKLQIHLFETTIHTNFSKWQNYLDNNEAPSLGQAHDAVKVLNISKSKK